MGFSYRKSITIWLCLYLFVFTITRKGNVSILDENTRNNLCESLNSVFTSIGINYRQRLKTTHYFLSLVLVIIIIFLFPSSIMTILGTINDNMAFFFIGICSFIVLLLTIMIYLVISYQYKYCNKSYHKLLIEYIENHTFQEWKIKYPDLVFSIDFPIENACCNSIDRKHGIIIVRKQRRNKICRNTEIIQKSHFDEKEMERNDCSDIDCLLTPEIIQIHRRYDV